MEFCPKCDSLMVPRKDKNTTYMVCASCGYKQKGEKKLTEKTKGFQKVEAIEKSASTLPTTEMECPECGNDTAYYRSEQTRAADEPETLFFTCTKCGKTWREYE